MFRKQFISFALIVTFTLQAVLPAPSLAGELLFDGVKRVMASHLGHLHRKRPKVGANRSIERLGKEIDWLQHQLDTYGTVAPKQPDVWGEARMTKHRREFEKQLNKLFDEAKFEQSIQGSLSRSDQSFLALSLSTGSMTGPLERSTNLYFNNSIAEATNDGADDDGADGDSNENGPPTPPTATDVAAFDSKKEFIDRAGVTGSTATRFSLEPTVLADQFSRYLQHLNEIRRINEGDDTADSPGYAMNLVRLPVSVLPGSETRSGYGAEITFTAEPYLSDDLLPTTIRNLVVNDIADQLALLMARRFNNDREKAVKYNEALRLAESQARQEFIPLNNYVKEEVASLPPEDLRKYKISMAHLEQRFIDLKMLVALVEDKSKQSIELRQPNAEMDRRRDTLPQLELGGVDSIGTIIKSRYGYVVRIKTNDFSAFGTELLRFGKASLKLEFLFHGCKPTESVELTACFHLGSRWEIVESAINVANPSFKLPIEFEGFDEESKNNLAKKIGILQQLLSPQEVLALVNSQPNVKKQFLNAALNPGLMDPALREKIGKILEEAVPQTLAPTVKSWTNGTFDVTQATTVVSMYDSASPSQKEELASLLLNTVSKLSSEEKVKLLGSEVCRSIAARSIIPAFEKAFNASLKQYRSEVAETVDRVAKESLFSSVNDVLNFNTGFAATQRNRRSPHALSPSKIQSVYGLDALNHIAATTFRTLSSNPATVGYIHINDIHQTLRAELQTAYSFMANEDQQHLWQLYCNEELVDAIEKSDHGGTVAYVDEQRRQFEYDLPERMRHTITSGLCWAIVVESALLNRALLEDMERAGKQKGCESIRGIGYLPLTYPAAGAEANETFKAYVGCRWPIHVFALDPINQEQNIEDKFSRRREMQLAAAIAVASGRMNANAAGRYVRRLETDLETIALNRTATAFSHGNDTFGWRFRPRVQTPETGGQLEALSETVFGVRRDADLRDQQLEPGMRECVAVVIMPSFVPYVNFHSRSNWFSLTRPDKKQWTMRDVLHISRSYQAIQNKSLQVCNSNCYRPEDIAGLSRSVQQMEKRLPQQETLVQIPYENTSGGFELFNTGVTDLGPELLGWYGAPGVAVGKSSPSKTTLFLVGDGFSVHESRVVAGGREIPVEDVMLMSRQIMRIKIPKTVNIVNFAEGKPTTQYIDVHVATPYGVTNHLPIPVYKFPDEEEEKKDAVADQLKSLAASVATLQSAAIQLKPAPTDTQFLTFEGVADPKNPGQLMFHLANPRDPIQIEYAFESPVPNKTANVQLALYHKKFLTTLLDVGLKADTKVESGKMTLDPKNVERHLAALSEGLLKIDRSEFKESQLEVAGALYVVHSNGQAPERLASNLKVIVRRPCEECKTK